MSILESATAVADSAKPVMMAVVNDVIFIMFFSVSLIVSLTFVFVSDVYYFS